MKFKLLLSLLFSVVIVGCTNVAKNGALLNQSVSDGIQSYQMEVEKIIVALGNTERTVLDNNWDTIYAKVEKKYATKHSIDVTNMTHVERRKIAAIAAQAYFSLLENIKLIENTLITKTRENAEQLVETNNEISKYLLSIEKLEATRNNIKGELKKIIGIDFSKLQGLGQKLIGEM